MSQQDKDVIMAINPYHLRYGPTDFIVLGSIFFLGTLFSWALKFYRRDKKKQLD
jgi:hypothetical protein